MFSDDKGEEKQNKNAEGNDGFYHNCFLLIGQKVDDNFSFYSVILMNFSQNFQFFFEFSKINFISQFLPDRCDSSDFHVIAQC